MCGCGGTPRQFVGQATARNRLPLDYSVASLRVVDFIVDGLRKGEPDRGGGRARAVRARRVHG